jgi:leucyl aminopeptidase
MSISFTARAGDAAAARVPLLTILLPKGSEALPSELRALDRLFGGQLSQALRRREFRGGTDESLLLSRAGRAGGPARVQLLGVGTADRVTGLRRGAAVAARQARKTGVGSLALFAGALSAVEAEALVIGASHGAWEYADLKTAPPPEERRDPLTQVLVLTSGAVADAKQGVVSGEAIAAGYATARRLAMMPPNLCTPDHLADTARELATTHGMKATVLGRAELTRLKAGAFLAVAQGTPQEPRLIALEYKGGRGAPVVLVGKGLCFDTGGISIKPAPGMEWMKFDMCGAAGVLGALEAIARLRLPINVVGLIGATTNMPSGEAYKPGDVVRAMNGKTIEVVNTDAEGRMVLADLLTYAVRYKPAAVVDAATLTGACVIALGNTATAVLGTHDALAEELLAAGSRAGEPGWRLPLWAAYRELIDSDVADMKNAGGRAAGTITAAHFLAEFIGDYPWTHLDIAGTAYSETDLGHIPKGPTGTPVGTFVEFVRGRTA